ncbi:MAG: zf-HC2 domain-containing protein [Vicinamibacterales bacterium]
MTPQQDPERALEPLIRQAVRSAPASPAVSTACLDPERLAAWADGGLRADEAAAVEAHAADCARCRALLAAFGRAGDGLPAAAPATGPRWARWRWKLLVPVAATAAALALYVAAPEPPPASPPATPRLSPRADQAFTIPEPAAPTAKSAPGPAAARAVPAPTERTAPPDAGRPESRLPAEAKTTVGAVQNLATTDAASQKRDPEATPSARGPQTRPPGPERGRLRETAADSGEERRGDAAVREVPSPAARAGGSAVNGAPAGRDVLSVPAAPLLAVAGEPARWRVDGDRLEHRDDSGAWEAVRLPSQVRAASLMAGRRVNGAVWLVGRAGTVVVSPNGSTFVLVTRPAQVDLSAVDAEDARAATVSAVDGRRFTTVDGGQTWRPR